MKAKHKRRNGADKAGAQPHHVLHVITQMVGQNDLAGIHPEQRTDGPDAQNLRGMLRICVPLVVERITNEGSQRKAGTV